MLDIYFFSYTCIWLEISGSNKISFGCESSWCEPSIHRKVSVALFILSVSTLSRLTITKSVGRGKHAPSFPKIRVCLYWIKLDIPFIIHACISDFFLHVLRLMCFCFLLIHNNLYHRCLGYTDIYSRYYTYVIIFYID